MKRFVHSLGRGITAFVVVLGLLPATPVRANLSSCTLTSTPHSVLPGSVTDFEFSLTNTNPPGNSAFWIKVTVPNVQFSPTSASAHTGSWTSTIAPESVTFIDDQLVSGSTLNFAIRALAGPDGTTPDNWYAQISDDPSGVAPVYCDGGGNTWAEIAALPTPIIGDLVLSKLTHSSVQIDFTTDIASKTWINYGLDNSYGTTLPVNPDYGTTHQITLTGLSPSSTYHFQLVATDAANVTGYLSDNTLLTADLPVVITPPAGGAGGAKPAITPVADTTSPVVVLDRLAQSVSSTPPVLKGRVSDAGGVAKLEYSTDAGRSWQLVPDVRPGNAPVVSYSFTPVLVNDDDYQVYVRATDQAGNVGASEVLKFTLDRLPPTVGAGTVTLGAFAASADKHNVLQLMAGVDQDITLSAVGGPSMVTIEAIYKTQRKLAKTFTLAKSYDTGLWAGVMSFGDGGDYDLRVRAVDGAGNKTDRQLLSVHVTDGAMVRDASTKKAINATLTAYYRDSETSSWVKWEGEDYRQANPILTHGAGQYGFYLPAGTYFLEVTSPGYQTVVTRSFTLEKPTPMSSQISMSPKPGFTIGAWRISLPWPVLSQTPIGVDESLPSTVPPVIGKTAPVGSFQSVGGSPTTLSKYFGKPTVLCFVSTWSTMARDQLAALASLNDPAINVVIIGSGQSLPRLASYASIAGLTQPILADSANTLTTYYSVSTLPTSIVLDRHGVVASSHPGLLSQEEIVRYALK